MAQSPEESERAAELLELLLIDADFRARFRKNPAQACEDFELHDLAREFGAGGKSLHTLEIRESRSSLAGAFMAAASEGAGGMASLKHMHEHAALSHDAHKVVHQALTSPKLQAVGHNPLEHTTGGSTHELTGAGAAHESVGTAELLSNSNLTLSPDAHAALLHGGADHRVVSVLEELTKNHRITIGSLQTTGGAGGDSLDILAVDGNRVSASNIAALDLADELGSLGPGLRPEHIVTPWPIQGAEYSTDSGHDDRIHIVFGTPGAASHSAVASAAQSAGAVVSAPPTTGTPPETSSLSDSGSPDGSSTPADTGTPPDGTPPTDGTSPSDGITVDGTPTDGAAPTGGLPTDGAPTDGAPTDTPPPSSDTTPADTGMPADAPVATTPPPVEATPPPAPVTPPTVPDFTPATTPPPDVPEPAVAGVGHQSVVLGAVPSGTPGHSTLQFEIPAHEPGAGGGVVESVPGAFDPTAAGGLADPTDTYPGDNAPKEQIAAWMGRQAHKMGLPAELPVMAGLVESGLKNDNYGDRDSLGFFQMRTSVWNQGEYAGFPDHPELQLKWFLNEALGVREKRIAEGDANYGTDPSKFGEWVADVERPAAEYRGRYALHLDEADTLLKQGNAENASAAGVMALGTFEPGGAGAAAAGSPQGAAALAIAEKYLGTPYHWGGDTPQTGFDCSGIAEYSYGQVGIHLPRVAADQFNVGTPVTKDQLRPGDLVFFKDSTGYVHHEGIYVGDGKFLHAPHTGDVVKISSLDEPYYAQQFAGGRDMSSLATGGVPVEAPAGASPVPVTPDPAQAPDPSSGDDVFGALGLSDNPKPPSGSTVQILPAVTDPSAGD